MAAAACAAAAAVQRAQILMQAKTAEATTLNGELTRKSPSKIEAEENHEGSTPASKDEDGSGAPPAAACSSEACSTKDSSAAADKDLNNASDSERPEGAPSSVEDPRGPAEQPVAGLPTSNSAISSPREPTISADEQSSLVESSSKESVLVQRPLSNVGISSNSTSVSAAPLLKEIIQGKLALAAAAALSRRHQDQDCHHNHHNPNQISTNSSPYLGQNMEQTLATAAANFARHNNNDLKEHASKNSAAALLKDEACNPASALMSQLMKMRQEMALNMSMQHQHVQQLQLQQQQHRNTSKPIVDSSDNEPTSPEEVKDEELDDDIDEDEELPIGKK